MFFGHMAGKLDCSSLQMQFFSAPEAQVREQSQKTRVHTAYPGKKIADHE